MLDGDALTLDAAAATGSTEAAAEEEVVVARQKQRLPYDAGLHLCERGQAPRGAAPKHVREAAVHGAKVAQQLRLVALRRAQRRAERARRADCHLYQVGERPRAAHVRQVHRVRHGNRLGVVGERVDRHVRVRGVGRQREQDGEKGVLEEDGLPELEALVLFKRRGRGRDSGSRCSAMAYAWRTSMPPNAHPSEQWFALMR
jgi:hypothetical protein